MMSFVLVLFTFFSPDALRAKMPEVKMAKEEGPVDIEANELIYDKEQNLYTGRGNVEVHRGDMLLLADHVQLDMATKDLVAWGKVLLREGEDVVECERLEINLDSRLGRIYQARLFLKDQNFHILGREIEKLGEARYRVRDGSFTTCDAKRPPWKFTVKELEVTIEGYGIAKHPVFHIEEIPFLYLPLAIFPVKKERQTGLLMPALLHSSKYGFGVKNAFFWAISKDMDSTLYLDWLGDRGFKEGLEYRYALTKNLNGRANLYFIDDRVSNRDRYAFFLRHDQRFADGLYLKGNVNHVSDNLYPQDFDQDIPDASSIDSRSGRQLRSNLFGGKNWDRFTFLAEGAVFNDLTKESNDETVQKLPQVSFYAHPQPLFRTPFFYDVASSYTHFWREKGLVTHRGDLFPRISYPVRLLDVLKLESDVGLRETFYRSYHDPARELNQWKTRETVEASTELGTEFYRVYEGSSIPKISKLYSVTRWMHTVEPTIGYRYSPRVKQRDLPIFDETDRLAYTSQITYGITQRLVGKPEKEGIDSGPYEYGKFKVSQSYSLGDPFQIDSKGREEDFSNIKGELWWNFSPYVSAQWDAELNAYRWEFDIFNYLVTVQDRRNDTFQVQYRYTRDSTNEINFYTRLRTIKPLYISGSMRYNVLEKMRVENVYGIEYQAQCWALNLTVQDKNRSPDRTQKKELKFQFQVTLLGIGGVGVKPGMFGQ
ncbi:MAG: LPS-assembly protein LptD [Syntrophaceae bacterium]|nr:LPS-assembly protein LptD [Syntrophaceae bacterium]